MIITFCNVAQNIYLIAKHLAMGLVNAAVERTIVAGNGVLLLGNGLRPIAIVIDHSTLL